MEKENQNSGADTESGSVVVQDAPVADSADLLSPLLLRSVALRNRIAMSPMCQYIATDGFASDWHLVHLGSRATGGVGLVIVEATGVTPEGRISPGCLGLWDDAQIAPLARIVDFVHSQGAKIGIQLGHAGRKASVDVPWKGGKPLAADEGAWQVIGPSAIPFSEEHQTPRALESDEIEALLDRFGEAAERAVQSGFDLIEIHAAHGYLLHSFLSPLSNQRTDEYGGSLENRIRLLLRVVDKVRDVVPATLPVFVRISATDWVEGGWDLDQSVALAKELKTHGVDLIDVSSGGLVLHAKVPVGKEYQVPLSSTIRREADIATGAVGLITDPAEASAIIERGDADLVLLGRQLLKEPYWAERAIAERGATPTWPLSYDYVFRYRR